jgi:hypothetical protein
MDYTNPRTSILWFGLALRVLDTCVHGQMYVQDPDHDEGTMNGRWTRLDFYHATMQSMPHNIDYTIREWLHDYRMYMMDDNLVETTVSLTARRDERNNTRPAAKLTPNEPEQALPQTVAEALPLVLT